MSLLNPELKIGDRVVVMDMSGESGIRLGLAGEVTRIVTVFGIKQYEVNWDDGSRLQLLSDVDKWMKEEDWNNLKSRRKKVDEQIDPDFANRNRNLIRDFKMAELHKFYEALRQSGVVNMFGASPYFYMGKERIAHEHFYEEMNDQRAEGFEKVLDMADDVKNILISGSIKTLEDQDKEISIENVQKMVQKKASQILKFIMQVY
jgi:dsDNA-binding SOS-regulon protein